MSKFKVGDKVRIKFMPNGDYGYNKDYSGEIGIIDYKINYLSEGLNTSVYLPSINSSIGIHSECLELVSECEPCLTGLTDSGGIIRVTPRQNIKNNKQTIMSKITTFAKNLVLSSDEKLLRKYGLKNECGEFTEEASELVIAKLVKENEAYLVELAKKMDEEENKK